MYILVKKQWQRNAIYFKDDIDLMNRVLFLNFQKQRIAYTTSIT